MARLGSHGLVACGGELLAHGKSGSHAISCAGPLVKYKIDTFDKSKYPLDHIYRAAYKHLGKNKLAHVNKEEKEENSSSKACTHRSRAPPVPSIKAKRT